MNMNLTSGGADGSTGGGAAVGSPDYGLTFCNPLPVPFTPKNGGYTPSAMPKSLADPDVIAFDGKVYAFATGGQAWVSEDLSSWSFEPTQVASKMTAPGVIELDGTFYQAGNGGELLSAPNPLGPWSSLGVISDSAGNPVGYADWMFFRDDDGKVYAFHNSSAGIGTDGIFVSEIDLPAARLVGSTKNCFAYDASHRWEWRGDANEDSSGSWLEGAFMTKHAGKYHLQYSAPGTEFWTYAVGTYTAASPAGPFAYDARSPLLHDNGSLMRGTGHHAVFTGPDGELWTLYHVLVRNAGQFERRLGMDRVSFDTSGNLVFEGPTQTPQWAPSSGLRGDTGLVDLAQAATASADSSAPANAPASAFDGSWNTWWEPNDDALGHSLSADLGTVSKLHGFRVLFYNPGPYQYRIETSVDGSSWTPAVDAAENQEARDNAYHPLAGSSGVQARHVRLTILGAPAVAKVRVIGFSAFGVGP
jgi:xylan 1,4-beta-xylosidase